MIRMSNVKDINLKVNKKYIVFTLLGILFLSLILSLTLTGSSIKAIKGAENVSYPIYISNNESIAGFQVEINYSTDDLSLVGIQPTERLSNAIIVYNNQGHKVKIAVLADNNNSLISYGNGAVLNLIFNVNSNAVPGNYSSDFYDFISSNINAAIIPSETAAGNIEIVEPYNLTFLPPITTEENFTLQEGATLPLKFNLTDGNDFVIDNSVLVRIYNTTLGIDHTYNASDIGNDYITIDENNELYLVNIHTGQLNMPEGNYNIIVSFDNYQTGEIGFELLDKANGIGKGLKK